MVVEDKEINQTLNNEHKATRQAEPNGGWQETGLWKIKENLKNQLKRANEN